MKPREFYVGTDLVHEVEIYRLRNGFWWYAEGGVVKQGAADSQDKPTYLHESDVPTTFLYARLRRWPE